MTDLFQPYRPFCGIATTQAAYEQLRPICEEQQAPLWVSPIVEIVGYGQAHEGSLKRLIAQLWSEHKDFIFGLALGATVRLIAPLLKDKATDPAVIVLSGQQVISVTSGHQGGGDRMTLLLANYLNLEPIITGACAQTGLPAIDLLGQPFGWRKGTGDWTQVSAAIANRKPVQIIQESGSEFWQAHLPREHSLTFGFPEANEPASTPAARVWISHTQRSFATDSQLPKVQWHPRVLWVGIGCERGTSQGLIANAIIKTFQQQHLSMNAIAGLASITQKADEAGLLAVAAEQNWPLEIFTPEELKTIPVPNPSDYVTETVGSPSVAEASALAAAQRYSQKPDTSLLVEKRVFRGDGAVTVAVGIAEREYLGRQGKLWLVGTGPGSLAQMTPAAQSAVKEADVMIGYQLYLDLLTPLRRAGQIVEAFPITQERQRAERALELANWGLTVAVVSSGDCGIYGMAGLVLELLQQQELTEIPVTVYPGVSALQSAASRVGAPLMHDFCAISLSDLLTPWEVICKRLDAAAIADFVTILYNPKSVKRTQQIEQAREIFLKHRDPQTPVVIATSLYRPQERIQLTTLAEMLTHPIDMLSTVLIGNGSTRRWLDYLVTPRGYLGKDDQTR
ncbi:MAG: precorrin-3B C(17)-methyltransferase [Cyanobacteria bacterium P01_H01_bin.15]